MTRLAKAIGWTLAIGLGCALVAAAWTGGIGWPHAAVAVDDGRLVISGLDPGDGLVGWTLFAGALLLLVATPLLLLVLVLVAVGLVVLLATSLAFSPLFLLAAGGWPLWRLIRRPAAGATISR